MSSSQGDDVSPAIMKSLKRLVEPNTAGSPMDALLIDLQERNVGPFSNATIAHIFKKLFKASLALMDGSERQRLDVNRRPDEPNAVIDVSGLRI